jgi:hypothetical protein
LVFHQRPLLGVRSFFPKRTLTPMAKLENSKRRLPQAVYAQVDLKTKGKIQPGRPWVKFGLVAAAKPTKEEIGELRQRLERDLKHSDVTNPEVLQGELAALDTIESGLSGRGDPDVSVFLPHIAELEGATLAALGERLLELREEWAEKAIKAHEELVDRFRKNLRPTRTGADAAPPELAPSTDEPELHLGLQGAALAARISAKDLREATESVTLRELVDWAADEASDGNEAEWLVGLAEQLSYDPATLKSGDFQGAVSEQLKHSFNVLTAFKKQVDVEPVGFLHLERLTFAPDGIERGELVYSVPLAPGEEVNIAHKEWATTAEEFQKIVTDYIEEYSEEGVTEKSELAQSTSSQQQHSSGINTGVTASGGYGPVSVTSSLSASISDSAQKTEQFSRNQSMSVTRKASTRSKKEHKTSFRVASASGVEDQAVRKIKNPFDDRATRVDYYQLIRKWEVNVYRYGIRLTYDITIPEPGSDVLTKIKEVNDLRAALLQGFADPHATLAWAKFGLEPEQLTRENYMKQAAKYGTVAPAPPAPYKWFDPVGTHHWNTYDESKIGSYFSLEIDTPEEYEVEKVKVVPGHHDWKDQPAGHLNVENTDDFIGTSGKRVLVYFVSDVPSARVELQVRAKLRKSAFQEWQLKAYGAIRDAAEATYEEQQVRLKDRLSTLLEELGAQDALSLRKFEREEIMKGVLRWLFGPDFEFVPAGLPKDLYAKDEAVVSNKRWKEVLAHGELIKFLHHAIEWENVLYFLYPYFWSHYARWDLKKYLDHPDPLHRAFLKAGSARVVLTIRQGFERDFASLLETGSFDGLPAGHPYLTIIEEMEAFANTNYAGIPPANPDQAAVAEEGVLIGTWHEYTPTSALTIAFDEELPSA